MSSVKRDDVAEAFIEKVLSFPRWFSKAACKDASISPFDDNSDFVSTYCSQCEIRDKCYDYAIDYDVLGGYWGGKLIGGSNG